MHLDVAARSTATARALGFSLCLAIGTWVLPASAGASETYDLERLMRAAVRYPAPRDLQQQLASRNRQALSACVAEHRLRDVESFFAAVPISLSRAESRAFLVFPTQFCPGFFGGHSIPFWIMESTRNGTYLELLFSAEDALVIEASQTRGYRDITTRYGRRSQLHRFNGETYAQ
ncbi:MAG: hypothetical protein ACKO0M_08050 [Cyanobium sp.]